MITNGIHSLLTINDVKRSASTLHDPYRTNAACEQYNARN